MHLDRHRDHLLVHLQEPEQLLQRNVKRFRRGLVFKAHRWLYHSTLGSRVIKKKKKVEGFDDHPVHLDRHGHHLLVHLQEPELHDAVRLLPLCQGAPFSPMRARAVPLSLAPSLSRSDTHTLTLSLSRTLTQEPELHHAVRLRALRREFRA